MKTIPTQSPISPLRKGIEKSQRLMKDNFAKVRNIKITSGLIVILGIIIGLCLLVLLLFRSVTKSIPTIGGDFREGILGQPQYINPVLSLSNEVNRPDRVIESLIYPTLFRLNTDGQLENELVAEYSQVNGREYSIKIREDALWDDGTPLTINDVIYTINTIQNPDYNSPLQTAFKGVNVTKIDEFSLQFTLNNSYSPFLSSLTFGILPMHIWKDKAPANFLIAEENLQPIGAGKFRYKSMKRDKSGNILSYTIAQNPTYFGDKPNIETITYVFYSDENRMRDDFLSGSIQAITSVGMIEGLSTNDKIGVNEIKTPQYFSIFFNLKDPLVSRKEIRQAMSVAINRDQIIQEVFLGKATKITGPLTPVNKFYQETGDSYSIDKAKQILDENNWKDVDGDGIREKDNQRLEITVLVANGTLINQVSELLVSQLREVGVSLNILNGNFADLSQSEIKNRSYQAILIGEALNIYPDPYIYWHSSQISSPGLNLSQYSNANNDGFLESARTNTDQGVIASSLLQFQQQVALDIPAIFLYSPHFFYYTRYPLANVTTTIGNSVVDRYISISDWYSNTKRVPFWSNKQ